MPRRLVAQQAEGRTIVDIKVIGDNTRRVTSVMKLREGDTYTRKAADQDIRRIHATRRYLDVIMGTESVPGGIRLLVSVTRKDVVGKVEYRGNAQVADAKIAEVTRTTAGTPYDRLTLQEDTRQIIRHYKENGHFFADVRVERERMKQGVYAVTFVIREGPRVRVRDIEFEGNTTIADRVLRDKIVTSAWFPIFSDGVYDEETVTRDAFRLMGYYQSIGFLDAEVTADPRFSPNKRDVELVFHVREGTQYRVRNIDIQKVTLDPEGKVVSRTPATVIDPEAAVKELVLVEGDPFDAEGARIDVRTLEGLYGQKGHVDADVRGPDVRIAGRETVDVVFEVLDEGRPVRLGSIEVQGNNQKTQTAVILRDVQLAPGDLLDTTALDESKIQLQKLNYFKRGSINFTLLKTDDPDVRDLRITVEDVPTGDLRFGAGVNSDTGLMGEVSVRQRNFDIWRPPTSLQDILEGRAWAGGGQVLTMKLSPGTDVSTASIQFVEPRLWHSDYSWDIMLFGSEREQDDYDESRYGLETGIGYRWTPRLTSRLGVRLHQIELSGLDPDSPPDVLRFEGETAIRSFVFSTGWDKRNRPRNPTEGFTLGGNAELATSVLGSDEEYWKLGASGSILFPVYKPRFFPERQHVLTLKTSVGIGDGYGNSDDIPIFERYFAGGIGSIRGFEYRSVGPRYVIDEVPLGGHTLWVSTAEY
ncbi:MAG: outer membrane protein assembly factor BamA, partial [Planctomycetota bacterium]